MSYAPRFLGRGEYPPKEAFRAGRWWASAAGSYIILANGYKSRDNAEGTFCPLLRPDGSLSYHDTRPEDTFPSLETAAAFLEAWPGLLPPEDW